MSLFLITLHFSSPKRLTSPTSSNFPTEIRFKRMLRTCLAYFRKHHQCLTSTQYHIYMPNNFSYVIISYLHSVIVYFLVIREEPIMQVNMERGIRIINPRIIIIENIQGINFSSEEDIIFCCNYSSRPILLPLGIYKVWMNTSKRIIGGTNSNGLTPKIRKRTRHNMFIPRPPLYSVMCLGISLCYYP